MSYLTEKFIRADNSKKNNSLNHLKSCVPDKPTVRTTPETQLGVPRNYKYEQERKLGKFFLDVCNGKKIRVVCLCFKWNTY